MVKRYPTWKKHQHLTSTAGKGLFGGVWQREGANILVMQKQCAVRASGHRTDLNQCDVRKNSIKHKY